jgi:hypothetical protein
MCDFTIRGIPAVTDDVNSIVIAKRIKTFARLIKFVIVALGGRVAG